MITAGFIAGCLGRGGCCGRGLCLRLDGWGSNRGFAHKNSTWLDGEGSGLDVTYELRVGLELDHVRDFDVAVDLAINDN